MGFDVSVMASFVNLWLSLEHTLHAILQFEKLFQTHITFNLRNLFCNTTPVFFCLNSTICQNTFKWGDGVLFFHYQLPLVQWSW